MLTNIQAAMLRHNDKLMFWANTHGARKRMRLRVTHVEQVKRDKKGFNGLVIIEAGTIRLTLYHGLHSQGYWYVPKEGCEELYFPEELGVVPW
jgi:hypothetical protein